MVWGHARQGQRSITPLSLPYHVFTPQKHGHARVQCVKDAAMCPALRLFTFLLTNTKKDYRLRGAFSIGSSGCSWARPGGTSPGRM